MSWDQPGRDREAYRKPTPRKPIEAKTVAKPISTIEQFLQREHLYGYAQEKVPERAVVTHVEKTPEGMTITYIPREQLQAYIESKATEQAPKDFWSWLGGGVEGFKKAAVERLFGKPKLIAYQEPKTFVALRQITSTQEWLRQAPVTPLPTFKMRKGGFAPPKVVFETPTEKLAQVVDVAKFPVGVVAPIESFAYPDIPTPMGALFSARQRRQLAELGPSYVAGTLLGEYIVGVGFAKGVGKVWGGIKAVTPTFIKEPISYTVKFGRIARAGHTIKMWTVEHLPAWKGSRIETWLAKRTATGKIEQTLIWGEQKFFLPGEFEFSESMQQIYKFVGFPVIYGKKATYAIIQVAKPTAFDQIAKAIERGMFPKMGTLSAQQILVTKKAVPVAFSKEIAYAKTAFTVSRKAAQRIVPILVPRIYRPKRLEPKRKEKAVFIPKVFEVSFEMKRLKFKPLEIPTLKPKRREKAFPALRLPQLPEVKQAQASAQIVKQVERQKQIQITIPEFPSPTIPEAKAPTIPPMLPRWNGGFGTSKRERSLYGKWFKREHRIKTPKEMMKTYLGVDLTGRGK